VWTWFYIVSQGVWVIVLIWSMIQCSKLKVGKDDDEPEFSTATWFSMLFDGSVGTGLFYYAVLSTVEGYGNVDEDATHALMVSVFHWGVHGWIPYVVMGATLGIMAYRRG
ncbi:unnamed protein product, partial [Prorocentrum cordatum]